MKIGNGKYEVGGISAAIAEAIKNGDLYFSKFENLNFALGAGATVLRYGVIENGTSSDLTIFEFDTFMEIIQSAGDVKVKINAFYEDSDLNDFTITPATGTVVPSRNLNCYDINKLANAVIREGVTVTGLSGIPDFIFTMNAMIKTTQSQSSSITSANDSFFANGRFIIIPKGKKLLVQMEYKNEGGAINVNVLGRMFYSDIT